MAYLVGQLAAVQFPLVGLIMLVAIVVLWLKGYRREYTWVDTRPDATKMRANP